ncbi:unnamed protein product [Trifolium pratense]|uniref:Uncharacterized protein n=1 Tax=Trifolium pratense TaxID=57577 RepID=A0ACB0MG97_TRIPR|nr:unnamed protein product [Trifolium pratense]
MQFQKKYPTHSKIPCFVTWRLDSQIFDEIIIGKEIRSKCWCKDAVDG